MGNFTSLDSLPKGFDEIIFENRNRSFGAYYLRKVYDKNILISCLLSVSLFSIILITPIIYKYFYLNDKNESLEFIQKVKVEVLKIQTIEKNIPPSPTIKIQIPNISTVKFLPPKITTDESVEESMPTQDQFKNAVASDVTNEADSKNATSYVAPKSNESSGKEEFLTISRSAEFPLGDLNKYLQSHLRYPSRAKRMEIQGAVTVAFSVSPEGTIENARIEKQLDPECDMEALRVVNSMPKWNPGMQNGYAIRQTIRVRIDFIIDEDE